MAGQSKLSPFPDVPELLRLMAECMPLESVRCFRLTSRLVPLSVDDVYLYGRFHTLFPELRKCGDDFALVIVRARGNRRGANASLFLTVEDTEPPNVNTFARRAIVRRNTEMLAWCVDTVNVCLHGQSSHSTALLLLAELSVVNGWLLGLRMVLASLPAALASPTPAQYHTHLKEVGHILCEAEDSKNMNCGINFVRGCIENFSRTTWSMEMVKSIFHHLGWRPELGDKILELLGEKRVSIDMSDLETPVSQRGFFSYLLTEERLSSASQLLRFFEPFQNPSDARILFALASYAARESRVDIAVEVTETISQVWKEDHQPLTNDYRVFVLYDTLQALDTDDWDESKKVSKYRYPQLRTVINQYPDHSGRIYFTKVLSRTLFYLSAQDCHPPLFLGRVFKRASRLSDRLQGGGKRGEKLKELEDLRKAPELRGLCGCGHRLRLET